MPWIVEWCYLATSSAFLATSSSATLFTATSSSSAFLGTSSSFLLFHAAVAASSILVPMSLVADSTIESRAFMRDSLPLSCDGVSTALSLNKVTRSSHPAKRPTNSFKDVFVFHLWVLALDVLNDFASCCAVFSSALPTSSDGCRDENIVRFLPRTERWNQKLIFDSLPSIYDQFFIVLLHGDIIVILGVVGIIFIYQVISRIQANDRVSCFATCLFRGVSSTNSGFLLLLHRRKIAQVRRPLSDLGYFHDTGQGQDRTGQLQGHGQIN